MARAKPELRPCRGKTSTLAAPPTRRLESTLLASYPSAVHILIIVRGLLPSPASLVLNFRLPGSIQAFALIQSVSGQFKYRRPHDQNRRISLCANDWRNRGCRKSVCLLHGPPCVEATSQKCVAGNSVIIDIGVKPE